MLKLLACSRYGRNLNLTSTMPLRPWMDSGYQTHFQYCYVSLHIFIVTSWLFSCNSFTTTHCAKQVLNDCIHMQPTYVYLVKAKSNGAVQNQPDGCCQRFCGWPLKGSVTIRGENPDILRLPSPLLRPLTGAISPLLPPVVCSPLPPPPIAAAPPGRKNLPAPILFLDRNNCSALAHLSWSCALLLLLLLLMLDCCNAAASSFLSRSVPFDPHTLILPTLDSAHASLCLSDTRILPSESPADRMSESVSSCCGGVERFELRERAGCLADAIGSSGCDCARVGPAHASADIVEADMVGGGVMRCALSGLKGALLRNTTKMSVNVITTIFIVVR